MTTTFQLDVEISTPDVDLIRDIGQKLIVVRWFKAGCGNVAWVAHKPIEEQEIIWTDEHYGLYATWVQTQGTVTAQSRVDELDIDLRSQYRFLHSPSGSSGFKKMSREPDLKWEVRVENGADVATVLGMTHTVSYNSSTYEYRPMNAVTLPATNRVTFAPINKVSVFLSSNVEPGDVVRIPPPTLRVDPALKHAGGVISSRSMEVPFSPTDNHFWIRYNSAAGGFVIKK